MASPGLHVRQLVTNASAVRVCTSLLAGLLLVPLVACSQPSQPKPDLTGGVEVQLSSPAFENNGLMPSQFATPKAGGQNVSPPLEWGEAPSGAISWLLVVVDRAPAAHNWVHWAVIGISPQVRSLPLGASPSQMPAGAVELTGTSGRTGYSGPQPPPGSGEHRYEFDLYALDVDRPDIPDQPSADDIERAVSGHVLGSGTLNGMYGQ